MVLYSTIRHIIITPSLSVTNSFISCSLDHLLDGGIYTAEVTELVGCAGSGKTQVNKLVSYLIYADGLYNV